MHKNLNTYTISSILIVGLYLIYKMALRGDILPAFLFALLPAVSVCCAGLFHRQMAFYVFFIINYIISGISRYIEIKTGMIMLALEIGLLILAFLKNNFQPYEWKRSRNFLTVIWFIWFVYCFFELFNPMAVTEAWLIAINGYALFSLICAILVPVFFTQYKDLKWLLILWAVLSMLAAAKGYWQKSHGFDWAELHWLWTRGASTHIIYSGIRYFSFFSDAASYGISMGLSVTVFGIIGFYVRPIWQKLLFWGTATASFYGMMISGTRSAVVVPIAGLIVYLILCKNIRHILIGGSLLIASLLFLTQTEIGNSNALIRRMRTTFDRQDASYQYRVSDKKKMAVLLKEKPFGIGIGLSGDNAIRFHVNTPLAKFHPNSTHTATWIETGIVGVVLYFFLLFLILLKASYIAVFSIRNKKLRGILLALIAGISGVLVAEYANTASVYPNTIIMSILFALLFTIPYYDKESPAHDTAA